MGRVLALHEADPGSIPAPLQSLTDLVMLIAYCVFFWSKRLLESMLVSWDFCLYWKSGLVQLFQTISG